MDGLGYKVTGILGSECGLKVQVFVDFILWVKCNTNLMWIRLCRWLIVSSNCGQGSTYYLGGKSYVDLVICMEFDLR